MSVSSAIREQLKEVRKLLDSNQMGRAQEGLNQLFDSFNREGLAENEPELRQTIGRFFRKRRRELFDRFDGILTVPPPVMLSREELDALAEELRSDLSELSERHIFQWATFYRDLVREWFCDSVELSRKITNPKDVSDVMSHEFAHHSAEIFAKGYAHKSSQDQGGRDSAIAISLSGLQRFMELPIELYSSQAQAVRADETAVALRYTCSSMLRGIIMGYGQCKFGPKWGWGLLPRLPRTWAHYLGFMTATDLRDVLEALDHGEFREGATETVLPLVGAIDRLVELRNQECFSLPALGQYIWDARRLEISMFPPSWLESSKFIELQCHLNAAFVTQAELQQAGNRGAAVVVASLRPDLEDWVGAQPHIREIAVNTRASDDSVEVLTERIFELICDSIGQQRGAVAASTPLVHNYACDFPLHNPFLARYFHVHRQSVKDLLRAFERRNGVRLWCSVRRSGKTTACADLGSTTGDTTIVNQTCGSGELGEDSTLFYERLSESLHSCSRLSSTFFKDLVDECATSAEGQDSRRIFVLDEYETLFETMRLALNRDPELRYTVVQRLLNQMLEFSRDNLLVFIGQRPDAHYIIMDQNQLSPYVEQDPFPLFEHEDSSAGSEFSDLLRKVLTDRIEFDSGFSDAVYAETGGHPYLTVNLLRGFFQWLIDTRRSVLGISISAEDYDGFADERLTRTELSTNPEYDFFRQAMREALSEEGRKATPWLHSVYSCLRGLAVDSPDCMNLSRSEFASMVERLGLGDELGFDASYLLNTAGSANFFVYNEDVVRPRIRLLARLSAVARPRIS